MLPSLNSPYVRQAGRQQQKRGRFNQKGKIRQKVLQLRRKEGRAGVLVVVVDKLVYLKLNWKSQNTEKILDIFVFSTTMKI